MVPEAVAGAGWRSANLGEHGDRTARRARGLEAALFDNQVMTLSALDAGSERDHATDQRIFDIRVAGPTALLVSKLHKVADRALEQKRARLYDKDALDLFRILQAIPTASLASVLKRLLEHEMCGEVTQEALAFLEHFFATPTSPGCRMVVRATEGLEGAETIARSCSILANALLEQMQN